MNRTTSREIIHLIASLLVLTVAFTYPSKSPELLAIVAFGVGTGFLLHELAHKFTAERYGYAAFYEASPIGLSLALGLKFLTGFVFAAPGAVQIRGKRINYSSSTAHYMDSIDTAKEIAYISVSGAVVNLILAVLFFIVSFFIVTSGLGHAVLITASRINVFLAGFNMIPFGPLDGAKVWRYNSALWLMVGIPSIALYFLF